MTTDVAPAPAPAAPTADRARYLREFVAGGQQAALAAIRAVLPQYIDDVTRDFGGDVYDRMLTDPAVAAAFDTYKMGVLSDGIRFEAAVTHPGEWEDPDPRREADADRAEEFRAFAERCFALGALEGQELGDVASELLDGLAQGHRVAEIVLKPGEGDDAGLLVPRCVKPKRRGRTAFVVDAYSNVLGLIGATPAQSGILWASNVALGELAASPGFIPRDKAVVFQHGVKDSDPRGTSVLRPAYNAWFLKTQVLPEFFKFLKQFASPGIIAKTPEGAGYVDRLNPDGTPVLDAFGKAELVSMEAALMGSLLAWLNASILVVKAGTEIDLLQSQGDGKAFRDACDWFDRQITLAILGTTRLTLEAEHGSRADSGIAQDVAGLKTAFQKGRLAAVLTRDLLRVLMRVNFGAEGVRLCPRAVLAKVEQQDWSKELDAVSRAYASGYLHDSQIPALDARLGLPKRDMAAMAREKAEAQHRVRMAQGDALNVLDPAVDPAAPEKGAVPKALQEGGNQEGGKGKAKPDEVG